MNTVQKREYCVGTAQGAHRALLHFAQCPQGTVAQYSQTFVNTVQGGTAQGAKEPYVSVKEPYISVTCPQTFVHTVQGVCAMCCVLQRRLWIRRAMYVYVAACVAVCAAVCVAQIEDTQGSFTDSQGPFTDM